MLNKKMLIIIFLIVVKLHCNNALAQTPPEPASGKQEQQEVKSQEYMVVTAHILASKAAENIIAKGGHAIDAAIAAQMVLNVVEPQSSGIGGGGFLLYYDKSQNKVISYDGRETAPANVRPNMFLDNNGEAISFMQAVRSGKAVGTPGLLAMLDMAHKEHGNLNWQILFDPAINVAKHGFLVSSRLNKSIKYAKNTNNMSEEFKKLYLNKNGKSKAIGSLLTNPEFSKILLAISENGAKYFYNSQIAADIASEVQKHGGYLSKQDFMNYRAKKREAVCAHYRSYKICGMGLPSSGGITTLQTLGILESFNLNSYRPENIHLILEAQKLAYADRNQYLADSDFVQTPKIKNLLNKDYLKKRANLISKKYTIKTPVKAGLLNINYGKDKSYDAPSTTHISIVDKEGNAASLTSSVEHSFGSGIIVNGFVLNNQLTDFSFYPQEDEKAVANAVAPNKRPRSSMSPTIIFDQKGDLYNVLGSPGGSSIIAYVIKSIIGLIDWNMPLKQIVDLPHFMNKNSQTELEPGQSKLSDKLTVYGHKAIEKEKTSGINAILIKDNILIGYSDPRREGFAIGR